MATVGDVMLKALLTVEANDSITDAATRMSERSVGAALVLTNGRISGILTERDVLRAVATGQVEGTKVAAWMTRDPETVGPSESTTRAGEIMIRGAFRHLPVVGDGGEPLGIVSIRDLVRITLDA
jgi:CBS domain-containing protein